MWHQQDRSVLAGGRFGGESFAHFELVIVLVTMKVLLICQDYQDVCGGNYGYCECSWFGFDWGLDRSVFTKLMLGLGRLILIEPPQSIEHLQCAWCTDDIWISLE